MTNDSHTPECMMCGDEYEFDRWKIGKKTCMSCGEKAASKVVRTVVPMHKSNYVLLTDVSDLKGINNKGGLVK